MNKKELFRMMCKSPREDILELSEAVRKRHGVTVVKKPSKTLVMLKMRETVAGAEYYLGELLACEAMVELEGRRGFALTAGDDFDKVLAMAIVDAAFNAGVAETAWLSERLQTLNEAILLEERRELGASLKSKVQFNTMEGA